MSDGAFLDAKAAWMRAQRKKGLPEGDPRHGTANGYTNLGCRCQPCRDANTARMLRNRASRVGTLEPDDHRHGKATTYSNYGCRCAACRSAWAADKQRRRNQPGRVVTPLPAHIAVADWTTQVDDSTFPFVEDADCNITGLGHQDLDAFAAAVNRYDALCGGGDPDEPWTAGDITHRWVTVSDDREPGDDDLCLYPVAAGARDAVAVTTLWGQR